MTLFVSQYCFQDNADDSPTDQCLTQNQVDDNNKDEVICGITCILRCFCAYIL